MVIIVATIIITIILLSCVQNLCGCLALSSCIYIPVNRVKIHQENPEISLWKLARIRSGVFMGLATTIPS